MIALARGQAPNTVMRRSENPLALMPANHMVFRFVFEKRYFIVG